MFRKCYVLGTGDEWMQDVTPVTLLDQDGIRRALSRIAYEILERSGNLQDLIIIGIRTRGWYLAQRLAARIGDIEGQHMPCQALDVSLFRDDRRSKEGDGRRLLAPAYREDAVMQNDLELARMVDGKRVVLVDDVLFTGRTVRAALDALTHDARPAIIQLAVLVDRGHRELPIRPDYVGKNLPTAKLERVKVLVKEVDGEDAVRLHKVSGAK